MDLTQLRKEYIMCRNQAKSLQRGGAQNSHIRKEVRELSKAFHSAICKQKKVYWDNFLTEETNIFECSKIPALKCTDGPTIEGTRQQAT